MFTIVVWTLHKTKYQIWYPRSKHNTLQSVKIRWSCGQTGIIACWGSSLRIHWLRRESKKRGFSGASFIKMNLQYNQFRLFIWQKTMYKVEMILSGLDISDVPAGYVGALSVLTFAWTLLTIYYHSSDTLTTGTFGLASQLTVQPSKFVLPDFNLLYHRCDLVFKKRFIFSFWSMGIPDYNPCKGVGFFFGIFYDSNFSTLSKMKLNDALRGLSLSLKQKQKLSRVSFERPWRRVLV